MSQFDTQDHYFQKAQKEGYKARSVYKLEEIQQKFNILKSGDQVLDLGSAPGSFLQYISKIIGEKGIAVGIDLQDIEPFKEENIYTFKGDIFDDELYKKCVQEVNKKFVHSSVSANLPERQTGMTNEFDVITSDLAPKTTGVKFVDGGASLDLSLKVLEIAKNHLKKSGNCVIKYLTGFNEGDLILTAKKIFKQVKKFRPKAVRKSSGESYLVCIGFYPKQ